MRLPAPCSLVPTGRCNPCGQRCARVSSWQLQEQEQALPMLLGARLLGVRCRGAGTLYSRYQIEELELKVHVLGLQSAAASVKWHTRVRYVDSGWLWLSTINISSSQSLIRRPLWGQFSEPPTPTWLPGQGVRSAALTPSRKPASLSHIQVTSYLVIQLPSLLVTRSS